jgi:hypothetical protein
MDERVERSKLLYARALFEGDGGALEAADAELDGVEADLALGRGRVLHGRFLQQRAEDPEQAREDPRELVLFERAAELYRARGDVRGEAEALFWVGCCHQVVRRDNEAAVPVLWRSLELATEADDAMTMSEALRHLGIAEHAAGRLEKARLHLEESTRLRREAGAWPGVAANLVGLIYIAAGQDRRDDGLKLAAEARAIAEDSGAQGLLRQIEEARAQLLDHALAGRGRRLPGFRPAMGCGPVRLGRSVRARRLLRARRSVRGRRSVGAGRSVRAGRSVQERAPS